MVESVAWMTGQKNVLSTFFYLLTVIFLLKANRQKYPWNRSYGISLLFFIGALLSKSITVTLPVSFLLISLWLKGSWEKKAFCGILPMMVLAAGSGAHYTWTMDTGWWARRARVGRLRFWIAWGVIRPGILVLFGKLIYPSPLLFIYPRWDISCADSFSFSCFYRRSSGFVVPLYGRRWWGKLPFACLLFFVCFAGVRPSAEHFTSCGFISTADHFQYLATSLGIFTLAGYGFSKLLEKIAASFPDLCPGVILVMFFLSIWGWRAAKSKADIMRVPCSYGDIRWSLIQAAR